MPTLITHPPYAPEFLVERIDCHTAHFATRWRKPGTAVITAHGDLDAANSQDLVDYALRNAARVSVMVIDLSGVTFFDTAGFSALHAVNRRCADDAIRWSLVPSVPVARLLRLCDTDSTLPVCPSVETALASVQGQPPRLLKLVAESR